MVSDMWLSKIFAQEFGSSDIHSNYSRTYSWMANQLGHLTLGLALTLVFAWLVETFVSYHNAKQTISELDSGAIVLVVAGAVLLIFGGLLIIKLRRPLLVMGMVSLVILLPVINSWGAELLMDTVGLVPSEHTNALLLLLLVTLAFATVYALPLVKIVKVVFSQPPSAERQYHAPFYLHYQVILIALIMVPFTLFFFNDEGMQDPKTMGVVLAATVFAMVVIFLAKDLVFVMIGLLGLIGSLIIAEPGFVQSILGLNCLQGQVCREIQFVGALLIIALGLPLALPLRPRLPWMMSAFYGLAVIVMAILFVWVAEGLEEEWRLPVGAAVASMSVWMTKEFGSDLPGIYAGLVKSRIARKEDLSKRDNDRLEQIYINTGFWDVCADGSFYLAGAWIGAGVLSEAVLLGSDTLNAWHEGPEILGLVLFGLIFVVVGKNWAYRQQAIDKAGLRRGNMLAVLGFDTEIEVFRSGASTPFKIPPEASRDALWRFARDGLRDPNDPAAFQHLIVIGLPVRNAQMANALTTEAALKSLRPEMFANLEPEADWRRARQMSYDLLLRYDTTDLRRRDLNYNPLWDHWYHMDDDDLPTRDRRLVADKAKGHGLALRSPHFLAVMGREPYDYPQAIGRIVQEGTHAKIESTAWFFSEDAATGLPPRNILKRLRLFQRLCKSGTSIAIAQLPKP